MNDCQGHLTALTKPLFIPTKKLQRHSWRVTGHLLFQCTSSIPYFCVPWCISRPLLLGLITISTICDARNASETHCYCSGSIGNIMCPPNSCGALETFIFIGLIPVYCCCCYYYYYYSQIVSRLFVTQTRNSEGCWGLVGKVFPWFLYINGQRFLRIAQKLRFFFADK